MKSEVVFKNFCRSFYFLLALTLISFIPSCNKNIAKVLPNTADKEAPFNVRDASPEFRQGWKDGCETGISSGANTFYKSFYESNKVDGFKMSGSGEYRDAWGYAFWYCFRSSYVKNKSSIWGSFFGGYK